MRNDSLYCDIRAMADTYVDMKNKLADCEKLMRSIEKTIDSLTSYDLLGRESEQLMIEQHELHVIFNKLKRALNHILTRMKKFENEVDDVDKEYASKF